MCGSGEASQAKRQLMALSQSPSPVGGVDRRSLWYIPCLLSCLLLSFSRLAFFFFFFFSFLVVAENQSI